MARLLAAFLFMAVVAGLFTSACASPSAPGSTAPAPSAPTPSTPAPVPPLSPTTTSPTIGQFATAGQTVFANRCAGCHGDKGQGVTGPAIMGSGAKLGKYNTAQGLFSFISTSMPLGAGGSLSQQQYQQVLCYLLVQNNFAPGQSAFDQNQLKNIALSK